MKKLVIILAAGVLLLPNASGEDQTDPLKEEHAKVEKTLGDNENQVVLAVDGLCCKNCGIGIGKKVCLLNFIDDEALPKGVKVHRKDALLTVALKEDKTLDRDELVKAIREAGYEPVRLYERGSDGKLKRTDIPKE